MTPLPDSRRSIPTAASHFQISCDQWRHGSSADLSLDSQAAWSQDKVGCRNEGRSFLPSQGCAVLASEVFYGTASTNVNPFLSTSSPNISFELPRRVTDTS